MLNKKRWMIVVVFMLIATILLSSCGQNSKEPVQVADSEEGQKTEKGKQEDNNDDKKTQDSGYKLPITDGSVTLTFMCRENQDPAAPTYGSGDLPIWNEVEKLTGVKIEWETAIASDYESVVQTRLAAGVDLPDMVCVPDPVPYLRQNIFVPMDDLIEQYAPDVKKMLEDNSDVKGSLTAFDGKIYCITQIPKEVNEVHTRIFWIREDWLERLGLDMPKTIDEWYEVLRAFKNEDANGNGDQNDEFPMISNGSEIGNRGFAAAFNIDYAYNDAFYIDENGKVKLNWIRPEAKEYMAFIKKLIDEQLFVVVADSNERNLRLSDDTAGSIDHWPDAMAIRTELLRQKVPDGRFVACPAPSSSFGEGYYVTPQPSYGYETGIFITKDCDKPEIAVQWINFLFSKEGYLLTNYGIEGETYVMEDGKPKLTESFLENPNQRMFGGRPSFANYMSQDYEVQVKMVNPFLANSVDIIKKFARKPSFPQVMPSVEEIDVLKTIGVDLITYVDENIDMFMLGERPLDEFEDFVKEVEDMGLEELLIVKRKQLERYNRAAGQ